MKRLLISAGTLVFIGAVVASATGAFFSDTETSTGNTFAAGAIDLQIDNSSYGFDWNNPLDESPEGIWGPNSANSWELSDLTNQLFFSFTDLKPGDFGEDTISLHVNDNDAYACMAFDLTGTPENGQNEPEAAVDVTAGADEGELQNYLSFLFWNDDGDNILEDDEDVIEALSGAPGSVFTGEWLALAESGDTPLPGDTTQYIGKGWCFGDITANPEDQDGVNTAEPTAATTGFTCSGAEGDHNDAQTDGIVVNVGFYAVQSRNNADFTCVGLPPFDGEGPGEEEEIGAALGDFDDATSCDVNVPAQFATIQAAINDGGTTNGETICVADGTFTENVTINKDITLSGSGATSTSIINGNVSITANGATLEGFEINGNVSSTASGVTIQYNEVNATGNGIVFGGASGAASSILHNVVNAPTALGIYLDQNGTNNFLVEHNTVAARKNGFGNLTSGAVQKNVFSNYEEVNGAAWEVVYDAGDTAPVITTNNFNLLGGKAIDNNGTLTFNANANWYGDASSAGNTEGLITTTNDQAAAYPQNP